MTDAQTTVLYALSTLAQTCAALAAFVGAVGIFRLQTLRNQRSEAERELRVLTQRATSLGRDMLVVPLTEVLRTVDRIQQKAESDPNVQAALKARMQWEGLAPKTKSSRVALLAFEAWNLVVIGATLVGFNYVPGLAASPWTFWAIWAAALGTVAVTGYGVFAWTGDDQSTPVPASRAASTPSRWRHGLLRRRSQ